MYTPSISLNNLQTEARSPKTPVLLRKGMSDCLELVLSKMQVNVNGYEAGLVPFAVESGEIDTSLSYAAGPGLQRMEAGLTSYLQIFLRVGYKNRCLADS